MDALKRGLRAVFLRLEAALEAVFGARHNPLAQLGALGFFFFWIVAVSGITCTSSSTPASRGPMNRSTHMTQDQWYLGRGDAQLSPLCVRPAGVMVVVHCCVIFAWIIIRGVRWFPG